MQGSFDNSRPTWRPHASGRVSGTHKFAAYLYSAFVVLILISFWLSREPVNLSSFYPMSFFVVLAGTHWVLSNAADQQKDWARPFSVLLALPLLIATPIGSILGFILIANSLKSWKAPAP